MKKEVIEINKMKFLNKVCRVFGIFSYRESKISNDESSFEFTQNFFLVNSSPRKIFGLICKFVFLMYFINVNIH
jgi:hypothetical protein